MNIEKKAIEIVMEYEREQNRNSKDVSEGKCGFDIQSGNRHIEVKGQSSEKARFLWINNSIVRKLGKGLAHYWVYVVYNINDKPKLKILEPDTIFKNLQIDTQFKLTAKVINSCRDEEVNSRPRKKKKR